MWRIAQTSCHFAKASESATLTSITTLQKFPLVAWHLHQTVEERGTEVAGTFAGRRCMAIGDEVHRSQGEEVAAGLESVLGGGARVRSRSTGLTRPVAVVSPSLLLAAAREPRAP